MEIPLVIILIAFVGLIWVTAIVKKKYGWLRAMYLLVPVMIMLGYFAMYITGMSIAVHDLF